MAELTLAEGMDVLGNRTRNAKAAIWAVLILAVLSAIGQWLEYTAAIDFEAYEVSTLTLAVALVYVAYAIAYLISVVLVSMWIHRAHANLYAAGLDGLDYTPGWSVGWFFIPILNLFKPFQAMRELWHASHGEGEPFDASAPMLLVWWWATWIVGNIADNASFRMSLSEDPAIYEMSFLFGVAGSVLTVPCAWLLLEIVRQVTAAQAEKFGAGIA